MRFIIASRTEAQKILLSSSKAPTIGAVVSIGSPGESIPGGVHNKPYIRLEFDDVCSNENDPFYSPPQEQDVKKIIDSAPYLLEQEGDILCHCYAGISRSSATAYILSVISKGPGYEQEALDELRRAFPRIHPNQSMVEIASRLLDNPAMLEVYNERFKEDRVWERLQSIRNCRKTW
jgi:predicted protein tyrosine phosphatase